MSEAEPAQDRRADLPTPEQYRAAQDLVRQALRCPPALRQAFLVGACGADSLLLREAEALLVAQAALVVENEVDIGTTIGAYRVERELGRGGMGVVYQVRRLGDDRRTAFALKLIRVDPEDEAVTRRFARERRVLASLEHPNIARFIDSGQTDDGRPYILMEFVNGAAITEYADRERLALRDRLELFQAVCSAVDHAHERHVVHRDIKPSNILVTPSGVLKLVDFGIAKLNAASESDTRLTASHLAPGTPLYASPEQLNGQPVDIRSDVYALGVVLFELLTGWWPFVPRDSIGSTGVVRPSDAVNASRQAAAVLRDDPARELDAVARARGTTPSRLARSLRGDLDAIVTTALREAPEDRYGSVGELSRDLERHLRGQAISVRRPASHRAGRFLRRHPVAASAVGAALMILGALAVPASLVRQEPELPAVDAQLTGPPQLTVTAPIPEPGEPTNARSQRPLSDGPGTNAARSTAAADEGAGPDPVNPVTPPPDAPSTPRLVMPAPDAGAGPVPAPGRTVTMAPGDAPPVDEAAAVRAVVNQYFRAMETGNTGAILRLYPSLDGGLKALQGRFALGTYRFEITEQRVQVIGNQSRVENEGTLRYLPHRGLERREDLRVWVTLDKRDRRWTITAVNPPIGPGFELPTSLARSSRLGV